MTAPLAKRAPALPESASPAPAPASPAPAPTSAGEPVRQRNPERTREQILQAAVAEFSTKGLGGARIDEIAARAGINKRMLYHYFGNKEDLFTAALEQTYGDIRRRESELRLEALDPVAAVTRLVDFTFTYFLEHPQFINMLNSENLHQGRHIRGSGRAARINLPLIDLLGEVLERGRAQGLFRADVDPVQLYISIAGICYFYFSNRHTLSTIFERDLLAEAALDARRGHVSEVILGYLRP